jgi:hypothetical protein
MTQKFRNLGKFRTQDVPPRGRDEAYKKEIARFKGAHFTAEREDGDLVIFAVTDELGVPAQEMRAVDRSAVRTLGDLNRLHLAHYQRRKSVRAAQ